MADKREERERSRLANYRVTSCDGGASGLPADPREERCRRRTGFGALGSGAQTGAQAGTERLAAEHGGLAASLRG